MMSAPPRHLPFRARFHLPRLALCAAALLLSASPGKAQDTFAINNTMDSGNNAAPDADSLRAANEGSAVNAGADLFDFNVNGTITLNTTAFDPTSDDKTLQVDAGDVVIAGGVIAFNGIGGLIKTGADVLTLTAQNTYTGDTTVNAGTLRLGANDRLANVTDITIGSGATFDLNGFNETVQSLASTATDAVVTFGTGTMGTFTLGGASSSFAGQLVNSGTANTGSLIKTTPGTTLTLTGNSSFTGGINLQGGSLAISTNNTALGAGTLTFSGVDNNTLDILDGRTLTNNIVMNQDAIFNVGAGTDAALNGVVDSGSGDDLIKTGAGTLTLGGNNTMAFVTDIRGGTLAVRTSDNALGTSTLRFSTADGNTLRFADDARSLANNVQMNADANFEVLAGNTGTLSGLISGVAANSFTKIGTGTLVLSGANTFDGATSVNAGVLRLGASNVLDDVTDVTIASGATLSLNGFNDTIRSLTATATDAVVALGSGTLSTGAVGSTFAGRILDTGSLVKLGAGTTLALTGNSSFSGGTDLRAGTLSVATNDTALGTGALTFSTADGNTLSFGDSGRNLANAIVLNQDANVDVGAGNNARLSGVISGAAANSLTKVGAGTLILSGASTYDGATNVNVGRLELGANNALDDDTDVTIASGATLALNTFSDTVRSLSSTATDATLNLGTGVLTVGAGGSSFAGVITDSGAVNDGALVKVGATTLTLTGNSTYAGGTDLRGGVLSVSTSNTALGSGALTFSTADNNTLSFADNRVLANAVNLNQDAILVAGTNINGTITGAISGGATNSLIKTGAGSLTLGGATGSIFAGGVELRTGVLVVQTNDAALGTGTLSFTTADGNTLLFADTGRNLGNAVQLDQDAVVNTAANAATLSGTIAGAGTNTLAKTGTGTLTLSGNNSFAGGVDLRAGTVAVRTNDSALGTGTLTFSTAGGNTLQFGETGRTIANAIALNQDGNVDTQGFAATLSSVISGAAANSLTKLGTGTLTLSGASASFAGGLTIGNGAVSITSANNIGTGTISFNDAGNDALLQLGAAMTLNNAIAVTQGGTFSTGGFDQTLSGAFAAGSGTLTRAGAGTVTLTGNSPNFNGTFLASEATTTLNGAVLGSGGAGNLTVMAGAALNGIGSIGGNLTSGGTLRPGFSVGTMTVGGNFNQGATGNYEAEINPDGTSDLVDATGDANLDGTLTLVGQSDAQANYFGRTFTVVEADGTINGNFATITDNLDILTPTVLVDNSAAVSRVQVSFNTFTTNLDAFAANPNQAATAGAIQAAFINGEAGADLRAVLNEFLKLNTTAQQQALQQIAGEVRASSITVDVNNASLFTTRVAGQMGALRGIFGGARSPSVGSSGPQDSAPRTARLGLGQSLAGFGVQGNLPGAIRGAATFEEWEEELPEDQVWVLGTGTWGDIDPTAINQGFEYDGQGFILGHTWEISDHVLAGAHVGYGSNEVNLVGGLDRTDIESFHLGAHATYYHDGDYLDGVIGITNDEHDTQRFIQFGAIDRVASGDFDSDQHYAYLEAGRTYELGDDGKEEQLHVQPLLALQYRNYTQDAYAETGADDLNLVVLENDLDMFQTALGARFFYTGKTDDGGWIIPDLMVRWAHEHGDVDRAVRSQFVGTSTAFTVNGQKQDRDSVQVRAGLTAATMDNFTVDVSYNGDLASNQKNHAGVLRLVWRY